MHTYQLIGSTLFGLLAASQVSAAIIKVGGDAACDFNNLPDALALSISNGVSDEIRLANNISYTSIAVRKTDRDELTIKGGFRNCTDPNLYEPYTKLDGSGLPRSVLTATGGRLYLINLLITGGAPDRADSFGGGVNVIAGAEPAEFGVQRVEFYNVRITGNSASNGGGLSIVGRPNNVIWVRAGNLSVDRNYSRNDGGGIYTEFANGTLDALWVQGNIAGNDGGGIWMGTGADLSSQTGRTRSGIVDNTAKQHGGGIALMRGGKMTMFHVRRSFSVAQISKNLAQIGGGMYLFNDLVDASSFVGSGINGYGNTATIEGAFAAIRTVSESSEGVVASIHVSAAAPPNSVGAGYCLRPTECNVFSENIAMDDNGALKPGAVVSIVNLGKGAVGLARFWNSTLSKNIGYNLFQHYSDKESGYAEEIHLQNSLVERNEVEKHLFLFDGDGVLNIFNSTFAQNSIPAEAISTPAFAYIRGSIFADSAPLLSSIPSANSIFNLLVRNASGLSSLPLIFEADPRFEDEANQNYRLRLDSPGLDREWDDGFNPLDLDRLPRNVDLTAVPDFNTPRDLGCFERQP